jgi:hypothetical protein
MQLRIIQDLTDVQCDQNRFAGTFSDHDIYV